MGVYDGYPANSKISKGVILFKIFPSWLFKLVFWSDFISYYFFFTNSFSSSESSYSSSSIISEGFDKYSASSGTLYIGGNFERLGIPIPAPMPNPSVSSPFSPNGKSSAPYNSL